MPTLQGTIKSLRPGRGFDTSETVSPSAAREFVLDGFTFCIRTLSPRTGASGLSAQESDGILNAGLGLLAVQRPHGGPWTPRPARGLQAGRHAANNAVLAGLPAGVTVFLDLRGARPETPSRELVGYCNNWFREVARLGYAPGLALTGLLRREQLGSLACSAFWHSQGPITPLRGCQIACRRPATELYGVRFGIHEVGGDRPGVLPAALTRTPYDTNMVTEGARMRRSARPRTFA